MRDIVLGNCDQYRKDPSVRPRFMRSRDSSFDTRTKFDIEATTIRRSVHLTKDIVSFK